MRKRNVNWKDVTCDPETTTSCDRFVHEGDFLKRCLCHRTKIPIYKLDTKCWKCGEITQHVTYDFDCGESYHIGGLPLLDKKLMELYPHIKRIYSNMMQQKVIANTCIHCGSLQGNFFILEELIDIGSSGEMLKIDKWI